ncbi:MAG: hypothetical protein WA705_18585 [Candidatus Ozemobacteraceae bacterium]
MTKRDSGSPRLKTRPANRAGNKRASAGHTPAKIGHPALTVHPDSKPGFQNDPVAGSPLRFGKALLDLAPGVALQNGRFVVKSVHWANEMRAECTVWNNQRDSESRMVLFRNTSGKPGVLFEYLNSEWQLAAGGKQLDTTSFPVEIIDLQCDTGELVALTFPGPSSGSLGDWLREGPRALAYATRGLALFRQLMCAVHRHHQSGRLHLDLTPDAALAYGMTVRLADTGIGRFAASETPHELGFSGFNYWKNACPPELQFSEGSSKYDLRSDVFSLGAILYEIVVAGSPENQELPRKGAESGEVSLRRFSGWFPGWESIIATATHPDPTRRYADVGAVISDFDRATQGSLPLVSMECPFCRETDWMGVLSCCPSCQHTPGEFQYTCSMCHSPVRHDMVVCPTCGFALGRSLLGRMLLRNSTINSKQQLDEVAKDMAWVLAEAPMDDVALRSIAWQRKTEIETSMRFSAALIKIADQQVEAGDLESALESLESALCAFHDNPDASLRHSRLLLELEKLRQARCEALNLMDRGNFDEARFRLRGALPLDGKHKTSQHALLQCVLRQILCRRAHQAAETRKSQGLLGDAKIFLELALDASPANLLISEDRLRLLQQVVDSAVRKADLDKALAALKRPVVPEHQKTVDEMRCRAESDHKKFQELLLFSQRSIRAAFFSQAEDLIVKASSLCPDADVLRKTREENASGQKQYDSAMKEIEDAFARADFLKAGNAIGKLREVFPESKIVAKLSKRWLRSKQSYDKFRKEVEAARETGELSGLVRPLKRGMRLFPKAIILEDLNVTCQEVPKFNQLLDEAERLINENDFLQARFFLDQAGKRFPKNKRLAALNSALQPVKRKKSVADNSGDKILSKGTNERLWTEPVLSGFFAAFVLIITICVGVFSTSTPGKVLLQSSTSSPLDPLTMLPSEPIIESPIEFVREYWRRLGAGDYHGVWAMLSPEFRKSNHSGRLDDLIQAWHRAEVSRIAVNNVSMLKIDGEQAEVVLGMTFSRVPPAKSIDEYYLVVLRKKKERGTWSILFTKRFASQILAANTEIIEDPDSKLKAVLATLPKDQPVLVRGYRLDGWYNAMTVAGLAGFVFGANILDENPVFQNCLCVADTEIRLRTSSKDKVLKNAGIGDYVLLRRREAGKWGEVCMPLGKTGRIRKDRLMLLN